MLIRRWDAGCVTHASRLKDCDARCTSAWVVRCARDVTGGFRIAVQGIVLFLNKMHG